MTLPIFDRFSIASVTLYPHEVLWLLKSPITMCDIFLLPNAGRANCSVDGLFTE